MTQLTPADRQINLAEPCPGSRYSEISPAMSGLPRARSIPVKLRGACDRVFAREVALACEVAFLAVEGERACAQLVSLYW
jgi:hypothetical protein